MLLIKVLVRQSMINNVRPNMSGSVIRKMKRCAPPLMRDNARLNINRSVTRNKRRSVLLMKGNVRSIMLRKWHGALNVFVLLSRSECVQLKLAVNVLFAPL